LHAIGFAGELLPIGSELLVSGQHIVVAYIEAELFLGAGDLAAVLGRETRREKCHNQTGNSEALTGNRCGHKSRWYRSSHSFRGRGACGSNSPPTMHLWTSSPWRK